MAWVAADGQAMCFKFSDPTSFSPSPPPFLHLTGYPGFEQRGRKKELFFCPVCPVHIFCLEKCPEKRANSSERLCCPPPPFRNDRRVNQERHFGDDNKTAFSREEREENANETRTAENGQLVPNKRQRGKVEERKMRKQKVKTAPRSIARRGFKLPPQSHNRVDVRAR